MNADKFLDIIEDLGGSMYIGVPDSLLSPFIDTVVSKSARHIVAANEGAAVGLAAGHYLATSKPAVVYMQNSGLGNAVNPICSLLHKKVYQIPAIFVIGWRGEPGVKDEPQHVFQGEITLKLLDMLEIPYIVVSKDCDDLSETVEFFRMFLKNGQSVAFVIQKDALTAEVKVEYGSDAELSREETLETILEAGGTENDIFVCTTGKLSREVFEIREKQGIGHGFDFLTVGSMGHSLMIALGIAQAKPEKRVFCLDGDGAVLMHMGSLAVTGANKPANLVHIMINNGAHETVGGLPTPSAHISFAQTAKTLGYTKTVRVTSKEQLSEVMQALRADAAGPVFIEVMCNLKSRSDLGRPTIAPGENKLALMENLK
ncbi:MAG: phosphonopyruvate decarboxylase [Oscillospiraceae bacterium]|nr:phosphonopyruvate decarboxylase [Oscillospiraceae bacterium]